MVEDWSGADEPLLNRDESSGADGGALVAALCGEGEAVSGLATAAARAIAFTIRGVAPHRQILGRLDNCSGVGLGVARISAASAMMKPGSQRPHWLTCSAAHACCSGWARSAASPSMVVTSAPSADAIVNWHDNAARPSTMTVHDPQSPL